MSEPGWLILDKSWINPFDVDLGIQDAEDFVLGKHPTGSFYTVWPQVTITDRDYVLLVTNLEAAEKGLAASGYDNTSARGEEDYGTEKSMQCYRKDNLNLIVTEDKEFFDKWLEATALAKILNLKDKHLRIALFSYILYGKLNE